MKGEIFQKFVAGGEETAAHERVRLAKEAEKRDRRRVVEVFSFFRVFCRVVEGLCVF